MSFEFNYLEWIMFIFFLFSINEVNLSSILFPGYLGNFIRLLLLFSALLSSYFVLFYPGKMIFDF